MVTAQTMICSGHVKDLTDRVFGRWTVIGFSHITKWKHSAWYCKCSCGEKRVVCGNSLRRKISTSCGCRQREIMCRNTYDYKHGHASGGIISVEYRCWCDMKQRCYNSKRPAYKYYGARGISVCERWLDSFPNFLADMGKRPGQGYSIDRIDNGGNYEPGNCRWATAKEQVRNRRLPFKRAG